jgi:acyl-CoA synthetase (AMP-forming)/AMP-acid ligase II
LDVIVEKTLRKLSCSAINVSLSYRMNNHANTILTSSQKLFCEKDLRRKADPKEGMVILYSRDRINFLVSMLITLIILGLLIIPVYFLWKISRQTNLTNNTTAIILSVLLVFTLVFSGVLSIFTRAKRHEVLAASAG